MKHFTVIALALCALLASCSKNEPSSPSSLYGSSFWACNYTAQIPDNELGENHYISLQFNTDASDCEVETSIVGQPSSINRTTYSVKWNSNDAFTLFETQGGQTIQYYCGTMVSSSTMSLDLLSCDKVERTVELRWMNQTHIE